LIRLSRIELDLAKEASSRKESSMPEAVQVGTILMSEWPQLFELETASYSGPWSVVKGLDGFAVDRKIRAAGWSFFLSRRK